MTNWEDCIQRPMFWREGRAPGEGVMSALAFGALNDGNTVYATTGHGIIEEFDALIGMLKKEGLVPEFLFISEDSNKKDITVYVWCDHQSLFSVNHNSSDGDTRYWIQSIDKQVLQKLEEKIKPILQPITSRGRVYVLAKSQYNDGLSLIPAGKAGIPFESRNYLPEAASAFEKIAGDITSSSPSGRFMLIDGPTGTGKTFLVCGLIDKLHDALFVILPPELVATLPTPDLIGTLVSFQEDDEKHTIVLIVEDADFCLLPRAMDNMGSVSSLLNLSDGILGRLLDLRIIATTNARLKEVEGALLRPGRLSCHVTLPALNDQQAAVILERLGKSDAREWLQAKFSKTQFTLAEVYDMASTK